MLLVVLFSIAVLLIYPLLISKELVAYAELIAHNSKALSHLFIKSSPVNSSPVTKEDMEIIYKLKISNTQMQLKKTKILVLTSGFFVFFVLSLPTIAETTPFSLTLSEMRFIESMSSLASCFLVLIPIFFYLSDIFIRFELFSFLEGLNDADDNDKSAINTLIDTLSPDKQELTAKAQSYINAVNNQNRALTKAEAKCICEFLSNTDHNETCQPVFLA